MMRITTQSNENIEITDIIIKGKKLFGQTKKTKKEKAQEVLLGEYENNIRVCEIFAEITCKNWNNDPDQTYTMPQT